jgi:murein DD-endopeptidase MepM/ murein hydrolase activator NlpD
MTILSLCDNGDILKVFRIVDIVITIIKIAVPIMLILSLMLDYMKAMYSGDSDALAKANKITPKRIVAAILVFYIPTFVYIIANISSFDSNNYIACLTNASPETISIAYESMAQSLVDKARNDRTESSYNIAVAEVNKLKDEGTKARLLNELEEIKKSIGSNNNSNNPSQSGGGVSSGNNTGWWFPAGSTSTTTKNGKLFASGEPCGTILTAYFAGNDSVHQGLGGGHGAIDIGIPRGSYVIATRAGTVVFPGEYDRIDYPDSAIEPDSEGNYDCTGLVANYVKIDHGDGTMSGYAHFLANTITVRAGDYVEQGQVIGQVGSSGCSTGPHLHFEVFVNGTKVDPLNYVSTTNPRP